MSGYLGGQVASVHWFRPNRTSTCFGNSEHPTEAGHALIAEAALRAIGAPVPEASTWAMMLLGFAGLSFAGYRTSRKSATVAA